MKGILTLPIVLQVFKVSNLSSEKSIITVSLSPESHSFSHPQRTLLHKWILLFWHSFNIYPFPSATPHLILIFLKTIFQYSTALLFRAKTFQRCLNPHLHLGSHPLFPTPHYTVLRSHKTEEPNHLAPQPYFWLNETPSSLTPLTIWGTFSYGLSSISMPAPPHRASSPDLKYLCKCIEETHPTDG